MNHGNQVYQHLCRVLSLDDQTGWLGEAESISRLTSMLVEDNIVDHQVVDRGLEEVFGLRSMNPTLVSFATSFIHRMKMLVPASVLRTFCVFPIKQEGNQLHLVMADPLDEGALKALESWTGSRITKYVCNACHIQSCIGDHFFDETSLLPDDPEKLVDLMKKAIARYGGDSVDQLQDSPYTIALLRAILVRTMGEGASDLHFESLKEGFRVRARLDGVLHTFFTLEQSVGNVLLGRIGMVAGLGTGSKPGEGGRDGRIDYHLLEERSVDIRVSIVPSYYGDKAVFRLFERDKKQPNIKQLVPDRDKRRFLLDEIHRPNGLILITGPTGCGKTTTLYSFLSELNTPEVNISTVEDPVEYTLPGITQIVSNSDLGITFANVLRSLLRQDPDIMMVGEIRDSETAEMAVKAASTGHLVLSTLHTNDAPGAIFRMMDLGVPPFQLASCGMLVIAQRLLRLICPDCKAAYEPDQAVMRQIGEVETDRFFRGAGCPKCSGTGYRRRLSVMEMLKVDDVIERMILEKASIGKIRERAMERGMSTLREEALVKLNQGVTTPEEVLRITYDV